MLDINYNGYCPIVANEGDAGNDLFVDSIAKTNMYIEYSCHTYVEIPKGYVGILLPRSSISNYDLILCNGAGVIDSGYRGELKMRFKVVPTFRNLFGLFPKIYKHSEKIGQLVIIPFESVNWIKSSLSVSQRGSNGFGSSN